MLGGFPLVGVSGGLDPTLRAAARNAAPFVRKRRFVRIDLLLMLLLKRGEPLNFSARFRQRRFELVELAF